MRLSPKLPDGYFGVPLDHAGGDTASRGPVRVCLLARETPDAVGGRFVVLSETLDTTAMVGCVLDAADRAIAWLRVILHDVELVSGTAAETRLGLTNGSLEKRWSRSVDALERAQIGDSVALGYERSPAPVLFYDPRKKVLSEAMDEPSGEMFSVCRDDRVLLEKGLPPFSASLHRYLWIEKLGVGSRFIAATTGAPDADAPLAEVLVGLNRGFEPVNARGGMMLARRLHPMALEQVAEVMGGGSWSGVRHGTSVLMLESGSVASATELGGRGAIDTIDPDRLYLGRAGRWGRLVETLHLKLRLICEAVRQVRDVTAMTGRPLFNITADSFESEVETAAAGLPRLWTARVHLIDAGTAVELPLDADRAKHVLAPEGIGRGVYTPVLRANATSGTGSLRIREAIVEDGLVEIDATLRSQERMSLSGNDIVMLRFSVGGSRWVAYTRPREREELSTDEVRLRSFKQQVEPERGAALRASEGVPIDGVSFEVLPAVSTPCDLHALGVLAARILLVNEGRSLPQVVDELLSLATRVADVHGDGPADERLESVFLGDDRWSQLLGPQGLVKERVDAAEAMDLVPPELWFRVLACVVRMFPGSNRDAFARDLGDAPATAPQRVFDAAIAELEDLLVRTRSLVVIDWRQNREVHAVLRRFREGLDEADAPVIPKLS